MSAQSLAPSSGRPPASRSETKMPWGTTVFVSCVSALSVSRTLQVSGYSCVHADHSARPAAAAPTRPAGVPKRLAKRYWPIQPPFFCGCQSIAAEVYVSTTWRRPLTSTGTAPGAISLSGNPAFVTACVRRRPRAFVVTSRRYVLPELRRSAYAIAGRPAASSVRPAGPKDPPAGARATTRSRDRVPRASQAPASSSTSAVQAPARLTTSPATAAFEDGTRPGRATDQPAAPRLATYRSWAKTSPTYGVPSRPTERNGCSAESGTTSAAPGEGRASA